ncbi:transcriptional regulator, TetR family [Leptospira inadai serovar Lyme str. 10]|uniref:Transcriptional regulator, TetR family n=2 Tax=Leptospira inadai serovar Lyme TaxID=293084 RepID=V6H8Q6_9LEPT|nr:TetR/AcrR family transcriptional regulator [Leptospira inadai]EQA35192.1 transcriptional regulator, TetR family [Leptospira inadai serovar Lyme str. 10]PNV76187.1 TetR family transcriptional regulator [Leptospira inadai serovar Lyme]
MAVRDPEDKKERILGSALRLFTERGFAATPMPELAKEAGIGAGTIYRYYKSKEELVNELYRFWKLKFHDALQKGLPKNASTKERFFHLWKALGNFYREYPESFEFLELHSHSPYLDEESRKVTSETMQHLAAFLEDAKSRGEVRTELGSMELVSLCYGAFVGMVKLAKGGFVKLDKKALLRAGEILWRGIAS